MKDTPRTTMFNTFAVEGMELRDYFAAKAMQAVIEDYNASMNGSYLLVSKIAYEMADEMMKARTK
jgi:hypothetical protein